MKYFTELLKKSRLLSNLGLSVVYIGGNFIQLIILLITSPIYATYLKAEEFAIIGYFNSLNHFFLPLFNLSLTAFYLMRCYRQNDEENKKLLYNLVVFLNIANAFSILLCLVIIYLYFNLASVSFPIIPYALIQLFLAYFLTFKTYTLLTFRINRKAWKYFLLSVSYSVFNALFSLYYIIKLDWGAAGRLGGPLTTSVLLGITCIIILRKNMRFHYDISLVKEALKYSYPLVFASYAYIITQNIDIILLERLNNPYEFGYFNIAKSISTYVGITFTGIFLAFEPDLYRLIASKNKKIILQYSFLLLVVFGTITTGFLTFSEGITDLLTNGRYTRAYKYADILVLSLLILQTFGLINIFFKATNKTPLVLIINISGAAFSVMIYSIFIHLWNFYGAAYGRVAMAIFLSLFSAIIFYYRNSKLLTIVTNKLTLKK